jgi:hypothetical protein
VAVTLAGSILIGFVRADDDSFGWGVTLGVISLAGAWVLTRPQPKLRDLPTDIGLFVGIGALAFAAVFMALAMFDLGAPLGQLFTGIAGVPAINYSDTDTIVSSIATTMGILFGVAAAYSERYAAADAVSLVRDPMPPNPADSLAR